MPVRAVFIDVGFTLVVCDGAVVSSSAARRGVRVSPAAVADAMAPLYAEIQGFAWPTHPGSASSAVAGSLFFRRLLELAHAEGDIALAAEHLWAEHLKRNVWRQLLPGAADALRSLHQAGFRLAAVSNSEGTVEQLLADLGLRDLFVTVVDSWAVGFSKPDRRIFEEALRRVAVAAADTVMVGDSMTADVEGARAVGIEGVLLDPYDLHRDAKVRRYPSFAAFAHAHVAAAATQRTP